LANTIGRHATVRVCQRLSYGHRESFDGHPLRINLLVQGAPFTTGAAATALHFARAVTAAGHQIGRVFFYKDAVAIGNRFAADGGVRSGWTELAAAAGIELAICVAAAGRRGIKDGHSLADGFAIVGLGQLIEAMEESDRLVSF